MARKGNGVKTALSLIGMTLTGTGKILGGTVKLLLGEQQKKQRNAKAKTTYQKAHKPTSIMEIMMLEGWEAALREAARRGDADGQRMVLQRMSYTMVGKDVTEQEKETFRQFVADFASIDPLYRAIILSARPLVEANPGVRQSAMYKHFPQHSVESMRYVFYYAEVLGHLVRVKKGNSYELYVPGQEIKATVRLTRKKAK